MRVLAVLHHPVFGGPHNSVARLKRPLMAAGFETLAVLPDAQGNARERHRPHSVDVVTMPLTRLRARPDPRVQVPLLWEFPRDVRALRALIRSSRSELVLITGLVNPHA